MLRQAMKIDEKRRNMRRKRQHLVLEEVNENISMEAFFRTIKMTRAGGEHAYNLAASNLRPCRQLDQSSKR